MSLPFVESFWKYIRRDWPAARGRSTHGQIVGNLGSQEDLQALWLCTAPSPLLRESPSDSRFKTLTARSLHLLASPPRLLDSTLVPLLPVQTAARLFTRCIGCLDTLLARDYALYFGRRLDTLSSCSKLGDISPHEIIGITSITILPKNVEEPWHRVTKTTGRSAEGGMGTPSPDSPDTYPRDAGGIGSGTENVRRSSNRPWPWGFVRSFGHYPQRLGDTRASLCDETENWEESRPFSVSVFLALAA